MINEFETRVNSLIKTIKSYEGYDFLPHINLDVDMDSIVNTFGENDAYCLSLPDFDEHRWGFAVGRLIPIIEQHTKYYLDFVGSNHIELSLKEEYINENTNSIVDDITGDGKCNEFEYVIPMGYTIYVLDEMRRRGYAFDKIAKWHYHFKKVS